MRYVVRSASPVDLNPIAALLAPEIAAGTVLPRGVRADEFLVAEAEDGALVGCVALAPWAAGVVELGALVAGMKGQGVGAALVRAALSRAEAEGYSAVVALTGAPGFFERQGFTPQAVAPHQLARARLRIARDEALDYKAKVCAACPRLGGCAQTLLAFPLHAEIRACA